MQPMQTQRGKLSCEVAAVPGALPRHSSFRARVESSPGGGLRFRAAELALRTVTNTNTEKCDTGQYQNEPQQTVCLSCTTGTYQDQSGAAVCKDCTSGNFQDQAGQSFCSVCIAGSETSSDFQPADSNSSRRLTKREVTTAAREHLRKFLEMEKIQLLLNRIRYYNQDICFQLFISKKHQETVKNRST